MNIVCLKCEKPYLREENGIVIEEMANSGPYKLWMADILRCPKCKHLIITGFGEKPLAHHYDPNYEETRKKWVRIQGRIYRFY